MKLGAVSIIIIITIIIASVVGRYAFGVEGQGRQKKDKPAHVVEWINIYGHLKKGEGPEVYPGNTYVDRGTEVLWANGSDTPLRIRFGKGKDCKELTRSDLITYPWLSLSGCISTQALPPQSIISIYPNEGGSFPFEIEFFGTDKKWNGTMKVL